MVIYESEDIVGYFVSEETVCPNCLMDKERDKLKKEDLILQEKLEDKDYFCDRCEKSLEGGA